MALTGAGTVRRKDRGERLRALFSGGPSAQPEISGWRNEWKCFLSPEDHLLIRDRLRGVAGPDLHAAETGGTYRIRSLYFDDWQDTALTEKLDGVDPREKFRIRMYNNDPGTLRLEKKIRQGRRGRKYTEALLFSDEKKSGDPKAIARKRVEDLIEGRLDWMEKQAEAALFYDVKDILDSPVLELYYKMRCYGLRPREVVEYVREPYVCGPGNVRVTFDYDLRRSADPMDLFDQDPVLPYPAEPVPMLMEVKWDRFLPGVISDAVRSTGAFLAFSKYAHCRMSDR